MNLYVSLGSSSDIGRKRPYKDRRFRRCGAQRTYPYITPHHAKTEGGEHGPRVPSRPLVTPQHHVGVLAASRSRTQVLWRGAEATGVADAMIEARH